MRLKIAFNLFKYYSLLSCKIFLTNNLCLIFDLLYTDIVKHVRSNFVWRILDFVLQYKQMCTFHCDKLNKLGHLKITLIHKWGQDAQLKDRFSKSIVREPYFSKGSIPNFQIPRVCFSPKYCLFRGPSPALEVDSIIVD